MFLDQTAQRQEDTSSPQANTYIYCDCVKSGLFFFFLESEKLIPSKNTQESPEKEAQWTKDMNRLFKEEKKRKENGLYIVKSYSVLLILREN